ncbi:MAG: hypothetical protein D3914_10475 [Candidatus Electrothrix sp. LOE2]|nr:hypothetical protein [Candidatus Electrothrix sp. LOE2]
MKNHILFENGMSHLLVYLEHINFHILRYNLKNVNGSKRVCRRKMELYIFFQKIQIFFNGIVLYGLRRVLPPQQGTEVITRFCNL